MGNPSYNASKTGAMGLTRTLGEAWAEDGIRVNGIAPGLVDTKMTKVTTANPKRLEGALRAHPAEAARHAGGYGRRRACSWPRRCRPTSSARPSSSTAGLIL